MQEIWESRTPTRKLKKLGFLPGNSGIQDSWQEFQDFPGSQMLGSNLKSKNAKQSRVDVSETFSADQL